MALIRISDKVWVNPEQVERVSEDLNGEVWVKYVSGWPCDPAVLFKDKGEALVAAIDEQVAVHHNQLRRYMYQLKEAILEVRS